MATAAIAMAPEMAVTSGVIIVMSRIGSPQRVFVAFKAAEGTIVFSMQFPNAG